MLRETKSTGTSSPDDTPDTIPDDTPDAAPDATPVEKVNIQHNNIEYGNSKLIFNGQHMNGNVFDFFSMYLYLHVYINVHRKLLKNTCFNRPRPLMLPLLMWKR